MPIYQAVCRQGVIVDVLAANDDEARTICNRTMGSGRYPFLYKLWREGEKKIRLKKEGPEARQRNGAGNRKLEPII